MQLIYAETVAVVIGLLLHAVLPWRRWTGAPLLPAVAGAACAITWAALTWARVPEPVLWLPAMAAAVLAPIAVAVPLGRGRRRAEEDRLAAVA